MKFRVISSDATHYMHSILAMKFDISPSLNHKKLCSTYSYVYSDVYMYLHTVVEKSKLL